MSFRITGLDPTTFRDLHALSDADLAARCVQRVRVTEKPGAPCRVSLADAEIGEHVLLLSFEHQAANTPYRQQGPIFVREGQTRFDAVNTIPPALRCRTLSLRGFDIEGSMVEAEVVEGAGAPALIEAFFANPSIAYIQAHYAKRGCYAARIDRA